MNDITVRSDPQDIETMYLEAREMTEQVEQVNDALDSLDPILDKLNSSLDLHKVKKTRIRSKLNQIMAKL